MYNYSFDHFQNMGILYGGFKEENHARGTRELNSSVYILERGSQLLGKVHPLRGDIPLARRSHSSCIADGRLVISGGMKEDGMYLEDFWSFDLGM